MEKVKLDNKRILFNLLPAHVAQHFLMSNPRNMVSVWIREAGLNSGTPEILQIALQQIDSYTFKLKVFGSCMAD